MPKTSEFTIGFNNADASFAALKISTALPAASAIQDALTQAVTDWAKTTIAGEAALRMAAGDLTISDLFLANAFQDRDLRERLGRNGIEILDATILQPNDCIPFDKALTDADQLVDDYGISIFCERSSDDDSDIQTEVEAVIEMEILALTDVVHECKKYGIDRASMSQPQAGVSLLFQSTTPPEDREFFEQGVHKTYSLHIHSVNGASPTPEDYRRIGRAIGAPFLTPCDKLAKVCASNDAVKVLLAAEVRRAATDLAELINLNGYLDQAQYLRSQPNLHVLPLQRIEDCVRAACQAQAEQAIQDGAHAAIEFIKSTEGETRANQIVLNLIGGTPTAESTEVMEALLAEATACGADLDEMVYDLAHGRASIKNNQSEARDGDDDAHDAAADMAATINNQGPRAQLAFLLQEIGLTALRARLQQDATATQTDRPRG